ncbi:uncharacterized protein SAPINGB_P004763 [Magnusiomyces paraingens]|uniref:DNA-directed RNA polymerase I subunit RPA49 n=1 Tax=Magnusiomyces paraingens TaxID=2606893 RepID=A0A5E8C252_9ASCO|nr:uncharacterized protein SAPINGB_P004763 [Saprochaete ingens]VVT55837.1 unnamed protein product [Saprochaete ingens]
MPAEIKDKKRKRSDDLLPEVTTVPISASHLDTVGPHAVEVNTLAIGAFGSVTLPESLHLDVYREKKPDGSNERILLHGETAAMDYEGVTSVVQSGKKSSSSRKEAGADTSSSTSQYFVAVYDPSTKSAELYRAPYFDVNPVVRVKRVYKGPKVKSASAETTNTEMRTTLGHAFGTRKAQKLLRSRELNQIDSSVLSDIREDIVDSVKSSTDTLPTQEQVKETNEKERLIPPCFENATTPSEVYPIESIIPPKEWQQLHVDDILAATEQDARTALLPFQTEYAASRLARHQELDATDSGDVNFVKTVYYLSFLLGVYKNRRAKKKVALAEKLQFPPDALVGGALARFSSSYNAKSRDGRFVMDGGSELKLIAYIAALALRIDGYMLEVLPLANELNVKPSKLQEILTAMGCGIKVATSAQAEALKLSKGVAANYKMATLTVPFKLPDGIKRRGGPPRR